MMRMDKMAGKAPMAAKAMVRQVMVAGALTVAALTGSVALAQDRPHITFEIGRAHV